MYDILAVGLFAFIFAFLYANEKDFLLKFLWLFVAIAVLAFGSTLDYVLSSTNYNATTGITTYTYALSNNLLPFTYFFGMLLIFMVAYFIWHVVKAVKRNI